MKRKLVSSLIMIGLALNSSMIYAEDVKSAEEGEPVAVASDIVATEDTDGVISKAGETPVDEMDVAGSIESEIVDETIGVEEDTITSETMEEVMGNQVILTLNTTKALVNGNEVTLNTPPTVVEGTTLLPLRFVANEVVGANVDWNSSTQTITITKADTTVVLTVGSKKAMIDGLEIELEVAPMIEGGVTLLPVRFISEAFDIHVDYDQVTKVITLTEKIKTVVDEKPNEKPQASFYLPQTYIAGQEVSVIDTSTDPDGDLIVDQLWSVLGEKTVTNKSISNIFKKPRAGTYTIGLQVQDARGLWSDWTYQTVTIEENKAPVVKGLTTTQSSYAQGEKIAFTYTYDNETWETVKEGKWTYRSINESPNRATLGKPEVLFAEGDYIITLYLDDAYGNRSEGVDVTVHITDEVKMTELAYRFTEGKVGNWIDNFQNTNYIAYKDANILSKTNIPGTLIMSDSPEIVKGEGILYQDKINGTGRLLIHHISGITDTSKTQRLAVIMRNETTEPVTVTLTNKSIKGPVADTLRAGQVSLQAYLEGVPAEVITLQPGESQYIYDKNWVYNQCVSGHVDVHTTGDVKFIMAAMNSGQDLNSLDQMIYFPADGAHYSGTYDVIGMNYDIMLSGNEPEKIYLGMVNSGEWVTGYDERDNGYVENTGNFGVSYYLKVTATEDTGVILNNRGGMYKGAIKWNDKVYLTPLEGTFAGTTTKAITLGIIKKGETVTIEYLLPNGSAAPTLIGFIPKSCW